MRGPPAPLRGVDVLVHFPLLYCQLRIISSFDLIGSPNYKQYPGCDSYAVCVCVCVCVCVRVCVCVSVALAQGFPRCCLFAKSVIKSGSCRVRMKLTCKITATFLLTLHNRGTLTRPRNYVTQLHLKEAP